VPTPKDSEPFPAPSLPPEGADAALWDEADMHVMRGPAATFSDPPPGTSDEPIPTIGHIGRYALKHRLGEGGIGTVYAAHDPLLSRLIAVKTLHVEVAESERESFNSLFLNEARAAAGLSHPHIVTVFDAGISDDRAYIAMELLKGRDLRQLRQEGWRATPAQAALIVRRVADALGYAHSKGVVHRDVKPANIFMIGRTQPKVLDFGIARIAHQHDAHSQLGEITAGSPYYMAPEQARHEPVDRRADVFSLGVVLYELLTDVKPFRGGTLEEITDAVLRHDPPLAHTVDAGVPEALSAITAKALAKNPEMRHRSARAFSRELRHWLEENTVSSEGDVQLGATRRPKSFWVAMAAVGALVVGGIAWGWLGSRPAAEAEAAVAAAPAVAPVAASAVADNTAAAAAMAVDAASAVPAAAEVAPASAPADPTPVVAATPEVAASVPAIVATPAAIPPAVLGKKDAPKETPKEKRTREVRERDARAKAAAATAATVLPMGLVHIAISPWGEVEVDGRAAGTSPPLTELSLPAGRHTIIVRNTDLPPLNSVVNVTADQPVTLKHKF
jgi:eukaryotic-like serine/threonine-protein kinase